ncbi:hypothetical protein R6U77_09565 [Lysinibacillus louembei]|uniref:Glycine zipper family protein n=1 Tax=Lysinibacillus louembei TaxID=1470088 RepID=A0ABZ0S2H8_9BACI|nr:hypothetical protein [Lysinibacillus louembei]WPK13871.1 hypothetical protein R6U77_09565 [Lysinibacillus louembei]
MEGKYYTNQSVNVYCPTVEKAVDTCSHYITNNERLLLEVPFEQYEEIISVMKQQVSDTIDYTQIIKKGAFTYAQIEHITLARNIHGLTMDEQGRIHFVNDAISISAVTAFAQSKWNGAPRKVAIENGIHTGLAVLGETFAEEVISLQIYNHEEIIADFDLNPDIRGAFKTGGAKMASKKMATAITKKAMISSAALKKGIMLLNTNVVTGALVTGMMSTVDIAHTVRGKMSSQQLFKNIAKTAASVTGGMIGMLVGSGIGLTIPNVSTAIVSMIGAIVGLLIGSGLASKITKRALDMFIRDDALQMLDIFNERLTVLAGEYLLNEKELEQALHDFEALHNMPKMLKEMYAAEDREQFADQLIQGELMRIVKLRMYLHVPTNEEIYEVLQPMAM